MLRATSRITGLFSLLLGLLLTVPSAQAQQPPPAPTARTLVSQRVELLPQGPLCWNAFRIELPPGTRSPAAGYAAEPLSLGYQTGGLHRLTYADGPTLTTNAGDGLFVGNNNWHAHENVGTVPLIAVVFALSCQQLPPGVPGLTQLANSGVLTGVKPAGPYSVQLAEVVHGPGAQNRFIVPGPSTHYLLEGALAVATTAGVTHYKAADIFTDPPGVSFEATNVGTVPARHLIARLWLPGEAVTRPGPDVRFPSPLPTALPRTGDELPWAGPAAMLAGVLLLTAGLRLRRAKA